MKAKIAKKLIPGRLMDLALWPQNGIRKGRGHHEQGGSISSSLLVPSNCKRDARKKKQAIR